MENDSSLSAQSLAPEPGSTIIPSLDCSLEGSALNDPAAQIPLTGDQPTDRCSLDPEPTNRKPELLKARYLRLKNKLSTVCYRHEQVSFGRELTTPNKSRLMKLSIEMEKQVSSQAPNQLQLESTLRELWKVVEHRRDNDLQVLRQSRFVPSLMEFFKRVLSSHRIQYRESLRALDAATKLLVVFCTVSANREYLILTGRFQTVASLFSWALSKKEEIGDAKIAASLSTVLCYLLEHRFEGDSTRILELSLEVVFYSQLPRRMKNTLEACMTEDGLIDEPMIKALLRLLTCMLVQADPRCQLRPVYEDPSDNLGCTANFQWIATVVMQLMNAVLIDRETGKCEATLCASHIAILLYGVRLLNIISRLNLHFAQKFVTGESTTLLSHVVRFCKHNYDNSIDVKQLLNESIVLLGYLALDNTQFQLCTYEQGLLGELCNLPTKFLIEKTLIEILMPTLCCFIHRNQRNLIAVFGEMSSLLMKKFLDTEMKTRAVMSCNGSGMHSRKLSLSSSNSILTQCSSINVSVGLALSSYSLKMRFPTAEWSSLYEQLEQVE